MSLLLFVDPRVTLRVPEDDKEERKVRLEDDKEKKVRPRG